MVNKKKILTFISAVVLSASLWAQAPKGNGSNIKDVEGNTYKTVQIGTQVWMAENLKTSKYSDGSTISNITDNTQWKNNTTGAWCYNDNDTANNAKYGKLYNWYAVSKTMNGDKNICPTGWHVPKNAEWMILTDYLGGLSVAGGKMKEVDSWPSSIYSNTDSNKVSLFASVPGGYRYGDGDYRDIGHSSYWWSSSENYENFTCYFFLHGIDGKAYRGNLGTRDSGYSVRCLRD
jgi:uncharacterized protein (TIGR02145 family)